MQRWSAAMDAALYGPDGFFRTSSPREHFRTSALAGPIFADAIARLVDDVDAMLGHPATIDIVDIGAGRGELLAALDSRMGDRMRLTAIEVAPRPAGLPPAIAWSTSPPNEITGLVLATEWLDNVPLEIAERDDAGHWRYLLADGQSLGGRLDPADLAWLETWWPDGVRVEIGRSRDEAWAALIGRMRGGLALAVDYGHQARTRPLLGSLAGFRDGRAVSPRPDGSCDLTAHIAVDALAAAGSLAAGQPATVLRQADALRALGVSGRRPDLGLARTDPVAYVRALATASHAADLTDTSGLGDHFWIQQPVAIRWPGELA